MSLSLKDISYSYRDFSVEKISFDCPQGKIISLVGESGSGKSTLLRLIAGLETPFLGLINILNRTVFDSENGISISTENRNIAMIFQHSSLFPNKTVFENIRFALKRSKDYSIAEEMMELVGMQKYADMLPFQISGGQQQLVTLARSFAQFPDLLLLDEPFSNLDTSLRIRIREKMISLINSKNLTTIIVTHDPYEALEISDKIVILNAGKVVMQGSPEEIYSKPVDKRTAELFGLLNVIDGKIINNEFHCDFGSYPLPGNFCDTREKSLYIRPSGIKICSAEEGCEAVVDRVQNFSRILSAQLSGKSYWVHGAVHILPKKYDRIFLRLDHNDLIFFD